MNELVVECVAAELGVEDRRRVDELGGFLELAGVEIGQGQRVARVEPGERAGGIVLQAEPLNVDVERVRFEPAVGVSQVAEQPFVGRLRSTAPRGERPTGIAVGAGKRKARVSRIASSLCRSWSIFSSVVTTSGSTSSLSTSPKRRCRKSVSAVAAHWSSSLIASKRASCSVGYPPRRDGLGVSFGFDITPEFDQGDQAIEPGAILETRHDGEPADSLAEVAG